MGLGFLGWSLRGFGVGTGLGFLGWSLRGFGIGTGALPLLTFDAVVFDTILKGASELKVPLS